MELLSNDHLCIQLLDPVADRERLGTRFCRGGYIWQIRDATNTRPLLAGPEWPEPRPDPFNGQGLPEVLRHSELLTGKPLTHEDGRGIIPGIGGAVWERGQPRIVSPAEWSLTREPDARHYCTEQRSDDWGASVQRSIELRGARVISRTQVSNTGARPLPVHWFAHPFFPLEEGRVRAALPACVEMNPNDGFEMEGGRLHFRRVFNGKDDGHFERLILGKDCPFEARIGHRVAGAVGLSTSFVPDDAYVWANGHTFSIEPYLRTTLEPGDSRTWAITYAFGETAG